MFERKPVRDKPFSEDCRQWLDLLVSDVVPGMEGGGAEDMIMSKEIRPGKGEGSPWGNTVVDQWGTDLPWNEHIQ